MSITMSDERVNRWLSEIRVLDGGFGTECQKRSHLPIDGHKAWSCRLLKDDPNLVCEIHKSYIQAGADVISTNTYQAAPRTLCEAMNIGNAEAEELMRHAVRLVRRAITAVSEESSESQITSRSVQRKLPILVAGSLGPYGACLADGSEYTGSYVDRVSIEELIDFHLARAQILINSGVDLIAWETIPALAEVTAICEVMRRLPGALAWLSVATQNGQTLVSGEPLHQVALEVDKCDQIFGLGVNCCIEHNRIGTALSNLNTRRESCDAGTEEGFHPPPCSTSSRRPSTEGSTKRKLFLVYANSGEQWVPPPGHSKKRKGRWIWPLNKGPSTWAKDMCKWSMRRDPPKDVRVAQQIYPLAQWVGGCCRVGPEQIQQLAQLLKPDEFPFSQSENETEGSAATATSARVSTRAKRRSSSTSTSKRRQPTRACKRFRSG